MTAITSQSRTVVENKYHIYYCIDDYAITDGYDAMRNFLFNHDFVKRDKVKDHVEVTDNYGFPIYLPRG